jgi:hypothetical protein
MLRGQPGAELGVACKAARVSKVLLQGSQSSGRHAGAAGGLWHLVAEHPLQPPAA